MTLDLPSTAAFAMAALCALASPAWTQTADRTAAYAAVGKSCAAETQRFCPALATGVPQPRSQAICLRPYKTSLSLSCRRAVKAASP